MYLYIIHLLRLNVNLSFLLVYTNYFDIYFSFSIVKATWSLIRSMDKFNTIIEQELARGANLSIVNLVDQIIVYAFTAGASDIHIDATEKDVRIRIRVDGVLEETTSLPKGINNEIISRIKVLARLRTDEHNSPQDGRFQAIFSPEQSVDVRVSVVPTYYGETAVLRLLTNDAGKFTLENLGFSKDDQQKILKAVRKSSGMILVTGPTGSGKTTTLYTLIKILNSKEISVVTIEDPIEYAVPGIEQIQVNSKTDLTFANGLRSILRQDPDVIMVGEIRDIETAGIAVNAALTGHLLLSTLHTNDVGSTLPRLLDMKIEPFLVSSTVSLVISQRLVRKICEGCKAPKTLSDEDWARITEDLKDDALLNEKQFFYGRGCDNCIHTGYKGRMVISEVLTANDDIRSAILRKASSNEIKNLAIENGMNTMFLDGLDKASRGVTTLEEVFRVTHE